jgi:hypothetical protein
MKFNKIQKLMKKGEKDKLESNPVNDVYHALLPDEPQSRAPESEEEDDLSDIEEKKRKRYEAIMKKYKSDS